jgi:L-serine kinase (ATP) / ParB family transcriptional regulator, heme-responsive regulator
MINYTIKFFNLDLLKISDIRLHETTESNRLRNLFERIAGSRHLMNPVIVGRDGKNLVLIDGANRLSTLEEIGCKLIIAQIIDYNKAKIRLKNWNHLVYGITLNDLIAIAEKTGLKKNLCSRMEAKTIYNSGKKFIAASDIKNGKSLIIALSKDFTKRIKELHFFTKFYFGVYNFDRSEQEIPFKDLKNFSRKNGVLIEFPVFTKKEIVKISKSKEKLPAGISRHILDNRVLHVRYDINKLRDGRNIEEKKRDLERYLLSKIDSNKVRQYRESVIVFDE